MENDITLRQEAEEIFRSAAQKQASDIHFYPQMPVVFRIHGRLIPQETRRFSSDEILKMFSFFMDEWQRRRFEREKETDFSFAFDEHRLRVNLYQERGGVAAALRVIPKQIKSFAELNLPPILEKFASAKQGFFIVTGPTGHGKSTTVASMIEYINQTRSEHIITIEDPIEYVFENKKSIIAQREVYTDTLSFHRALRSALREDPNVIFLGEMRDKESTAAALTLAETGHLVLTTLHTNNAAQTIDRIVDIFPEHQQRQIRQQLANTLLGIISQRLLPRTKGGRIVACEILIANIAVRSAIREGKTHQIPNIIQTSFGEGMMTLDKALAELVKKGEVKVEDALVWAEDPQALRQELY
ncbi:type IV pilus twitching motility protein PilT [bacterium]|nr:type IV pilus twitching motility protein PilT [bacterium]